MASVRSRSCFAKFAAASLALSGLLTLPLNAKETVASGELANVELIGCGGKAALSQDTQLGLMRAEGDFRLFIPAGAEVTEFQLEVRTPGAFDGGDFPADVCAAVARLETGAETDSIGALTFTEPDPKAEHRGFEYQAEFDRDGSRLMFQASGDVIWGYLEQDGKAVFFTGAARDRWPDEAQ